MTHPRCGETLLDVRGLVTEISHGEMALRPVDDVTFSIARGETVGLVGESGSGKTMLANSILRLLPANARIATGSIEFAGRDLAKSTTVEMCHVRGNDIGMVFQNPMTSLNPRMTIGDQVAESVRRHQSAGRRAAKQRAIEMLGHVGIPDPERRYAEYPHRLSGGLRQRVLIAMALVCDPALLIADEPTTALDVTIQAGILDLIDRLKQELSMAVLLVTHDMAVIAGRADRVLVMYAGRIVEQGSTDTVLTRARHRYTRALLDSIPTLEQDPRERLLSIPGRPPDLHNYGPGCRFSPRCAHVSDECRAALPELKSFEPGHLAACIHPVDDDNAPHIASTSFQPKGAMQAPPQVGSAHQPVLQLVRVCKTYRLRSTAGLRRQSESLRAVRDVTLDVWPGETLGIVGESGSGKSTLARMIVGLERPTSGEISFRGAQLATGDRRARSQQHHNLQLMFQDAYSALDPRMRVGVSVAEPMVIQRDGDRASRLERTRTILTEVGLAPGAADLYPQEFSGGQLQRVNFARALVMRPAVIVADEPVSALDASVRSQVLNIMKDLQRGTDLSYIFISHDLAVVRYLADRIGVMFRGKLVEFGNRESVFERPAHPYTVRLLDAVPSLDTPSKPRLVGEQAAHNPMPPPEHGCPFAPQCPRAQAICTTSDPPLESFEAGNKVACHFPVDDGIL
jgi:peptide/nickel transport system ATP-binding protein